jgi:hypothetical protein
MFRTFSQKSWVEGSNAYTKVRTHFQGCNDPHDLKKGLLVSCACINDLIAA